MATCRHMVLSSLDFTPRIKRSRTASTNRGMHCRQETQRNQTAVDYYSSTTGGSAGKPQSHRPPTSCNMSQSQVRNVRNLVTATLAKNYGFVWMFIIIQCGYCFYLHKIRFMEEGARSKIYEVQLSQKHKLLPFCSLKKDFPSKMGENESCLKYYYCNCNLY